MKAVQGILVSLLAVASLVAIVSCQKSGTVAQAGEIHIDVTDQGFVPAEAKLRSGQPTTLVFTRKTEQTCATEVVIADLGVRRLLPMGQPVRIEVPAGRTGTLSYACGMDMVKGQVSIQ
jgi:plastocyanin domain-containing protein